MEHPPPTTPTVTDSEVLTELKAITRDIAATFGNGDLQYRLEDVEDRLNALITRLERTAREDDSDLLGSQYADEDADGMLLLIGSEDDGRVYISVQDREPVVLTPDRAEAAGQQLLARAAAGRRS